MKNISGQFFDSFAVKFDTFYDEQRGPIMRWIDRKFRSDIFIRFEFSFERLAALKGMSVLDIGCGSGPYLLEAVTRDATQVTGIDPARKMLELAKQRLAHINTPDKIS